MSTDCTIIQIGLFAFLQNIPKMGMGGAKCCSSYLDLSHEGLILFLHDGEVHRQRDIEQWVVVVDVCHHDTHCSSGCLHTHNIKCCQTILSFRLMLCTLSYCHHRLMSHFACFKMFLCSCFLYLCCFCGYIFLNFINLVDFFLCFPLILLCLLLTFFVEYK